MHLVSVDFFLFYFFTYPSEKAGGFTKERERDVEITACCWSDYRYFIQVGQIL